MSTPSLSIVVPCYNEVLNLPLIIQAFKKVIDKKPSIQIVLVDNGSTDNTADVLDQIILELDHSYQVCFKPVFVKVNQGYGYGILQGLANADGDVLAWTHADMQTDPLDVLVAYQRLIDCVDVDAIVKGKRKSRPLLDNFFTWGMQVFTFGMLGISLNDINAQPKLFNRVFYHKFLSENAPHDFSLDLFLLYQAKKNAYSVLEVPVIFADRQHGDAKGGGSWKTKFKLIKRTAAYIMELKGSLN